MENTNIILYHRFQKVPDILEELGIRGKEVNIKGNETQFLSRRVASDSLDLLILDSRLASGSIKKNGKHILAFVNQDSEKYLFIPDTQNINTSSYEGRIIPYSQWLNREFVGPVFREWDKIKGTKPLYLYCTAELAAEAGLL